MSQMTDVKGQINTICYPFHCRNGAIIKTKVRLKDK